MDANILYIGDQWLLRSSLSALAIFTNEESKLAYCKDMLEKNIISEYGYKCLTGEYGNNTQAETKDGVLLMTVIPLNPTTSEF